jgi:hypothetical protein
MPPAFDVHVHTAQEAIELLEKTTVKRISLDHDLGDEQNGTGYQVAKWIESRAFAWSQGDPDGLPPLEWSIHSA